MTLDLAMELDDHQATARCFGARLSAVEAAAAAIVVAFASGNTLYTCGNGGSAADAQHLTGEFIGHYSLDRRPLPAVTLSTDPSVITCIANDYDGTEIFARQVEALAGPGDILVAFSTSGTSPNVVKALAKAKAIGATAVLFTGARRDACTQAADIVVAVPSEKTARIQEMHTLAIHLISEYVDRWVLDSGDSARAGVQ